MMSGGYSSAQLGIDPTTAGTAASYYSAATAQGITSATSAGVATGLAIGYTSASSASDAVSSSTLNAANKVLANQFLTIDVGSNASGQTKVKIGLPTVDLTMDKMDTSVYLWDGGTGLATGLPGTNAQKLGDIYIGNLELLLGRNGYIDIYATNFGAGGASGVTINLGANIDILSIKALSWGDSDGVGLSTSSGAGYVGLTNMLIQNLNFVGFAIDINVATVYNNNGTEPLLPNLGDAKSNVYKNFIFTVKNDVGDVGKTWVDIGLAGTVTMGSLYANVALGTDKTLGMLADGSGAPSQLLGQLYMSGLSATITPGSWVTIAAH
jgi:hypothetical protein